MNLLLKTSECIGKEDELLFFCAFPSFKIKPCSTKTHMKQHYNLWFLLTILWLFRCFTFFLRVVLLISPREDTQLSPQIFNGLRNWQVKPMGRGVAPPPPALPPLEEPRSSIFLGWLDGMKAVLDKDASKSFGNWVWKLFWKWSIVDDYTVYYMKTSISCGLLD